ncbi:hypothetical protein acdb102_26550 [Acidothermaceae bacterium B102]|nr:hypothetical protein acdb102_26550 [Acidothermaceae bacterium B102]
MPFITAIVARRGIVDPAEDRPSIGAMTSDSLLHPVGSLPPEVYWRRRALAGVLAVLVLWLAWSAFPGKNHANAAQGPAKAKTPAAALTPSATPTPAVTTPAATVVTTTPPPAAVVVTSPPAPTTTPPKPTTPAVPLCQAVGVTVSADHTVYAAAALPKFVLTVTNTSAAACRVDVGTVARGFTVTSGSDRIWSSQDCTKNSPNVAVFAAKQAISYTHVWNRARSSSAGCAAQGTQARPGTYKVTGHVGGLSSDIAVFQLR